MGFFSTLLGLLVRPTETLTRLESQNKELHVELASGFLVSTMFLSSLTVGSYFLLAGALLGNAFLSVFGAFSLAEMMIAGVVGTLLGAIWYHLWLWLLGVRNWRRTFVAYSYAHAPGVVLLVSVFPEGPLGKILIYGVIDLWTLVLFVRALRVYHGLPPTTSGIVLLFAFLVNLGLMVLVPLASVLFPQPFPSIPNTSAFIAPPPVGGLSPG